MPRSVFLGRLPEPGEPAWTEEDRAWAIALLTYEADLCPGCGHSRAETTDPEAEGRYRAKAIRCHGCAAVARTSEIYATPPADPRGLYMSVTRDTRR